MKKLCLAFVVLIMSLFQLKAQPFEYGDNVLNIGIGLAPVGYGYTYAGYSPGLEASFEHGFFEKLGIGYISIGGYAGFRRATYDWVWDNYSITQTIVAARGAYHFDFLDLSGEDIFEKFDVYAGVLMGLRFETADYDDDIVEFDNSTSGVFDTFIGGRYYFSENFGAYSEISYAGISYFTVGLSFKF